MHSFLAVGVDLLDHVFWPALLEVVRRRKARGKVTISLTTAADVLKAVSLKVMSPAETREVFGLKKRRVPVRRKVAKP